MYSHTTADVSYAEEPEDFLVSKKNVCADVLSIAIVEDACKGIVSVVAAFTRHVSMLSTCELVAPLAARNTFVL